MLTCVYHPIDSFRVVEHEEANRMKASGVWFDSPLKAQAYRERVENELKPEIIKKESKVGRPKKQPEKIL